MIQELLKLGFKPFDVVLIAAILGLVGAVRHIYQKLPRTWIGGLVRLIKKRGSAD